MWASRSFVKYPYPLGTGTWRFVFDSHAPWLNSPVCGVSLRVVLMWESTWLFWTPATLHIVVCVWVVSLFMLPSWVWWIPSTGALVSNTPPQAGRVLCTTRVLYRYSAFVGGSMHPYAHDTGKTLAGKRYVMRPRYGPFPANSIIRPYLLCLAKLWVSCTHELPLVAGEPFLAAKR